MKKILLLISVCIANIVYINAQPGTLDPSFGVNGKVSTLNSGKYLDLSDGKSVVFPDGKIMMVGYVESSTDNTDFILAKYNANGTLDNTFSGDGLLIVSKGGDDKGFAPEIKLQADGKIVLLGTTTNANGDALINLVRLNSNGTLDNNFGTNGVVKRAFKSSFTTSNDATASALCIQSDQKILVGGTHDLDFGLIRFTTTGALDNTFNSTGVLTLSEMSGFDLEIINDISIQSDGKILISGYFIDVFGSFSDKIFAAKINVNGTFDNTFGTLGKSTIVVEAGKKVIPNDVAIQNDNKIIFAGISVDDVNGTSKSFVLRLTNTGILDNNFNSTGRLLMNTYTYNIATSLQIQSDQKILITSANEDDVNSKYYYSLARLNTNGSFDLTFSNTGQVFNLQPNNEQFVAADMHILSDGKILLTGRDSLLTMYKLTNGTILGNIDFVTQNNSLYLYPNPVESETIFSYTLLSSETVSVSIFDQSGKLVAKPIINQKQEAGEHKLPISISKDLRSGIYLLQLASEKGKVTIKMVKK